MSETTLAGKIAIANGGGRGIDRAIIDACRPYHWRDKCPIVNMPKPETARKAKELFSWLFD